MLDKPGKGGISDSLFLSPLTFTAVRKTEIRYALHHTGCRVSKEFTPWAQSAINSNVMFRCHEEVGRLWRMVGSLLRDIVALRFIWIVPPAGKSFAQDGIERFLDSTVTR